MTGAESPQWKFFVHFFLKIFFSRGINMMSLCFNEISKRWIYLHKYILL